MANMASATMKVTAKTERRPSWLKRIISGWLALGLGFALLGLGLPQTADSLLRLYAENGSGAAMQPLSDSSLAAPQGVAFLKKIDEWTDDPELRIRAGVIELRSAADSEVGNNGTRPRDLVSAVDDLENGLSRAPANAVGWAALAHARLLQGDSGGAKAALRISLRIAPFEPALLLWRCQLGLTLWPTMDSDDRRLVEDEIRMSWGNQPAALLALARLSRAYVPLISLALAQDPKDLIAFSRAFNGQR